MRSGGIELLNLDCLSGMKSLLENSIDAIVTDPPYGIRFMGNKWDYEIPNVDYFREMYRVVKPGSHVLVCCGTKTQHRMAVNIEDGGFEIRDIIAWVYGSGFPKNHNLQIDGKGTSLKPSMELWTLARKPLSEKNVIENYKKWGVGAISIEDCRVPGEKPLRVNTKGKEGMFGLGSRIAKGNTNEGRFPSNFIHDGTDDVIEFFPKNVEGKENFKHNATSIFSNKTDSKFYNGESKSSYGSAARFFYCSKASKKERLNNDHPTVKPLSLISYLIKLISNENQVILDPYSGSGTTAIACINTNRKFLGYEISKQYFDKSIERIFALSKPELFNL